MKAFLVQRNLEVKQSKLQGYGVFSREYIRQGEIIEECQVLVITKINDELNNYYFKWPDATEERAALPLGYGCIYNHSKTPNASWDTNTQNNLFTITAARDIAEGQEITISYGEGWFAQRDIKTETNIKSELEKDESILLGKLI